MSSPYKCAFCAHESKTKSVLMMHIKTKHPAEYEASGGAEAAPASAIRTEEKSSSWAEEVDLQDLELTTRPVPGQGNKATQPKSSQGNQARGNQGGQGQQQSNQGPPRGNQGNQGAPRGNQGNQINQIAEKMVSVELAEKKPKPSLLHGTQEIRVKYSEQVANMELYTATKTFEELNLPESILKGIYAMKFDRPSKIQETVLPLVIRPDPNGKYNNLIAQSQSGTGKTAAFALAMLTRVNPAVKKPQAMCITNVRELANQVSEEIRLMAKFTEIQVFTAIGGSKGAVDGHIVVGTPGTLITLGERRQLNLGQIKIFVLDEADFLLDAQNMRDQTVSLLKALSPDCQLLLFSATFSEEVRAFAQQYVPNATEISLKREELNVEAIGQYYVMCNDLKEKYQVLLDFASLIRVGSAIVFCETKDSAWYIADAMHKSGYQVALLTGDHKSNERDDIMQHFRELKTRILITTNVISRGIDIAQVNVVINFDLPVHIPGRAPDFETYLHRIGRTGRFGKTGTAVNLVDQNSWRVMKEFEAYFGAKINELPKDFDDLAAAVEEIKL